MNQHGHFLAFGEEPFDFRFPLVDPAQFVPELVRGQAFHDRFDATLALTFQFLEFGFVARAGCVLIPAKLVRVARVFLAEHFHQPLVHKLRLQCADDSRLDFVLPDGKSV